MGLPASELTTKLIDSIKKIKCQLERMITN